jgi:hypothetical protein
MDLKTQLQDRSAMLKSRWASRPQPAPRMSDDTRVKREALGDLVASPAWQRIQDLKAGFISAFKAPIPTRLAQQKQYETYCLVRDILDEFTSLIETDVQLSSVIKEEQ